MKLVLHMGVKQARGFRLRVVIDTALGENVGDLLIDPPFAGANRSHPLQQLAEIVLAKEAAVFQALIIHGKASMMYSLIKAVAQMRNCVACAELTR